MNEHPMECGDMPQSIRLHMPQQRSAGAPHLSVILAVRDPDYGQLSRCVASISALRSCGHIEILVVTCGETLRFDADVIGRLAAFRIVVGEARGVYPAYNEGCRHARAPFVIFFGADDIALPGLDDIISALDQEDKQTLLYAGPCLMQGKGIHRPSFFRLSITYRNWCHQGIVYRKDCVTQRGFSPDYAVLADHYLNIQILASSRRSARVFDEPVAYFSAGGASSLSRDVRFQADQLRIVTTAFGWPGACLLNARNMARLLLGHR